MTEIPDSVTIDIAPDGGVLKFDGVEFTLPVISFEVDSQGDLGVIAVTVPFKNIHVRYNANPGTSEARKSAPYQYSGNVEPSVPVGTVLRDAEGDLIKKVTETYWAYQTLECYPISEEEAGNYRLTWEGLRGEFDFSKVAPFTWVGTEEVSSVNDRDL